MADQSTDTRIDPNVPYRWEEIATDTPTTIVAALGGPDANRVAPGREPVRVLRSGVPHSWPTRGELVLEDGTHRAIGDSLPADLPPGYHDFHPAAGDWSTRVIITPWQCIEPAHRAWGWAAQLHSARSRQSWGFGDLADLRRLAEWSAELGAGFMLLNPLGTPAPVVPQSTSPYFPSSRRFRNPLYLRVEEVPGAERVAEQIALLAAAGRDLNALPRLDRDRVFELKHRALRAIWGEGIRDERFTAFRRQQGAPLERFAAFCALTEKFGPDWRTWPAEYRQPDQPAVARFAAENTSEVGYHAWLQWLIDLQLTEAGQSIDLVQDLPIGFDPGGADAWEWQDLLAEDMNVGAPPDLFNTIGQDWSLPPFVPARLRAARYEPFIQTIRAVLRHAGGLRIDHVMGLFRLWWIPRGAHPRDGWYVRYPADDLLGILALESQRAGAFLVGEDLGTVEPGVRERLALRRLLSCRLLWFEPAPPREYPELAMASITTHDLPTVAGLWTGADEAAQQSIGLPVSDAAVELRERIPKVLELPADAPMNDVIERAYRYLGNAPSRLIVATLEDAQAVAERPNMPGTTVQWPNWSHALPQPIEEMLAADLPRRIAESLKNR